MITEQEIDNDLLAQVTQEIAGKQEAMPMAFAPLSALQLTGLMLLVLKHPELPDSHRDIAHKFIATAQDYFADCPGILELFRRDGA